MDVDALPENNYRYIDATITLVYSPGLDSEFVACGWSADTPRASRLDNLLIGDLVVPVADISSCNSGPRKNLLEHRVCITLRRIVYIRVVQKILNAEQNLEKSKRIEPIS